jgi:hypothetical protein
MARQKYVAEWLRPHMTFFNVSLETARDFEEQYSDCVAADFWGGGSGGRQGWGMGGLY